MKKTLFLIALALPTALLGAEGSDTQPLSGKVGLEAGSPQGPGSAMATYQYSRLQLESHEDILTGLSLGLEGEADWQSSGAPMAPSWPLYPATNLLKLETNWGSSSVEADLFSLRLNRAYLHWASGSLDVTAGLFKPDWGSSYFYRPTDYFFPLSPLQWKDAEPLGSEGLDASCFIIDDLSLEGAVRWLQGGNPEGLLKAVDKGIGPTITPSIAWMTGRDGYGLELVGTFPTFQLRLEGVDWLYADGHATANWTLGLTTSHEGIKYTAEVLRDGSGEILGGYSELVSQATYVFLSAEGKFFEQWKAAPSMAAALEGGPFLFWPRVSCDFAAQWEAGFQAQIPVGKWKGPLDLYPGRAGISLSYSL